MPKIVSRNEEQMTLEAIYQTTLKLIRKKGILKMSVDDIIKEVKMARGSFYKYYPSKEACIWEVLKRYESEMMSKMETIFNSTLKGVEKIKKALQTVYLTENNLAFHINRNDFMALLRKLPEGSVKQEKELGEFHLLRIMDNLKINKKKVKTNTLRNLFICLQYLASNESESKDSKEAIELIIHTIAEYMATGVDKEE